MTRLALVALVLGSVTVASAPAAEKKVGKTFADILSRVKQRDEDSGAILRVKMRDDAPPYAQGELIFDMAEGSDKNTVTIRLTTPSLNLNVYEEYVLVVDDAIREELGKLALMRKQAVEKAKKWREEQTEKVRKVTGGKLKFGMTEEEVVKLLGKPQQRHSAMAAGVFYLEYADWYLSFNITLVDVRPVEPGK
jgi:hypothetical protein